MLSAFLFFASCGKDDAPPAPVIDITEPVDPDPVFIEADPNINDGVITFETTGPSFAAENRQGEERAQGNWSNFGETGETR